MTSLRILTLACSLALAAPVLVPALSPTPAAASEIKLVVNKVPVTTYDIQRRAAFLKLQNRKGNLNQLAEQEMIDQALKLAEMRRVGIRISDAQVSASYQRFAQGNKLSVQQLDGILNQAGVTRAHFREYIRSQMGWGQVVAAWKRTDRNLSKEQVAVQDMLKKGGPKPSATEYMLQQVIFVVPAAERGALLGKRRKEAEAMRARFAGCDRTREFSKGLIDVTVRDLGRRLAPELPPDWAEMIKKTPAGSATGVRETQNGVEFIGVCSSREVSDDKVAELVLSQNADTASEDEASKVVLERLREKAQIQRR